MTRLAVHNLFELLMGSMVGNIIIWGFKMTMSHLRELRERETVARAQLIAMLEQRALQLAREEDHTQAQGPFR